MNKDLELIMKIKMNYIKLKLMDHQKQYHLEKQLNTKLHVSDQILTKQQI